MTGNIVMDNMDVTLVKLLTLNGEIDDGNSSTADTIDWNSGAAHKSTLTGNVTLAFTGHGLDILPTMTGATSPSGTASASSEGSGNEAWRAFNDALGESGWLSSSTAPQWLQYQFPTAHVIIEYSITTMNAVWDTYQPKDWTLSGSNNGTDWTTIDTVTSGFSSGQNTVKKYFTVDASGSYAYYRINVTAAVTAGGHPAIAEVELIETATSNPAAPCFLTLKLVQDGTGGRTVTWPATVKGNPVINQAANSVSNVLFYWDGTNYYCLNGLPWVGVPAAANSAGFIGQMAYDTGFIYVCTAANTWKRVAIATW
jgi:hypothetical protein